MCARMCGCDHRCQEGSQHPGRTLGLKLPRAGQQCPGPTTKQGLSCSRPVYLPGAWVDPCQVSWLALPPSGHPQSLRTGGLEWTAGRPDPTVAKAIGSLWVGGTHPLVPSGKGQTSGQRPLGQPRWCSSLPPAVQRERPAPQHTHPPRDTPCLPVAPGGLTQATPLSQT